MRNNIVVRRLLCFITTLVLMFSIFGVIPVGATGITEITFGQVSGRAGDEVVVPVKIVNNPGIATFRFRVSYDVNSLEFVSAEKGSVLTSGTMSNTTNAEEETMTFLWYSVSNVTGDGEIALLKFKILNENKSEYPVTVKYLPEDLLNEDWQQIPYTVNDGKISIGAFGYSISGTIKSFGSETDPVTLKLLENNSVISTITSTNGLYAFYSLPSGSYIIEVSKTNHATTKFEVVINESDVVKTLSINLLGDVNGDGKITAIDARWTLQYSANNRELTDVQISAADVNGDGKVTAIDARWILQASAGNRTL